MSTRWGVAGVLALLGVAVALGIVLVFRDDSERLETELEAKPVSVPASPETVEIKKPAPVATVDKERIHHRPPVIPRKAAKPKPERDEIPRPAAPPTRTARNASEQMRRLSKMSPQEVGEQSAELRARLLDPGEGDGVRNNICNRLIEIGNLDVASDLISMVKNPAQSERWRSYCVQQLRHVFEKQGGEAMLTAMFDAAEDRTPMVRSAAIWNLALLSTPRAGKTRLDKEAIGGVKDMAVKALRDEKAHFLVRAAGVQSCARLGIEDALPEIRSLAGSDATRPQSIRVSAIAALGQMGDAESLPMLEKLATSSTGMVKSAAKNAVKKIQRANDPGAEPERPGRKENEPLPPRRQ